MIPKSKHIFFIITILLKFKPIKIYTAKYCKNLLITVILFYYENLVLKISFNAFDLMLQYL